jgi:hypothetical protein
MPTGTNLGVQQSDLLHRGHITTAGGPTDPHSYVLIISGEGASTWAADMRGTFSAGTVLVFEVTLDGQNWVPDAGTMVGSVSPALTTSVSGPGPADYTGTIAALQQFRVRATSLAPGDDVLVTLRLSVGVGSSMSTGGGGGGGSVTQGTIPWVVSGQGIPGTPASGVISVQGEPGMTPIAITGSIVADNPSVGPTGAMVPADATLVGGQALGGNLEAPGVTLPDAAATAFQQALVVALSPGTPLPTGSNVIGEVSLEPQLLNAQKDPSTGSQTNNLSVSTGVALSTALRTTCLYSGLGGEFYLRMTPASESLLGVFKYQVPVGFTLYITNVVMPSPLVVQQFAGTPAGLMWELYVASSSNPSMATGVLFPLLTFGAVEGQRAGSNLSGGGVTELFPQAPVVVPAGSWVLICYKVLGVGSNTGAFRGTCNINGYFQPL